MARDPISVAVDHTPMADWVCACSAIIELLLTYDTRSISISVEFSNTGFSKNAWSNKQYLWSFDHKPPCASDYEPVNDEWDQPACNDGSPNFSGNGPLGLEDKH